MLEEDYINLERGHELLLQRCYFYEDEVRDLKRLLSDVKIYASNAITKPADEKLNIITNIITDALGDHIDVT